MSLVLPEGPIVIAGTLVLLLFASRWHFFGRLPLWPVNAGLMILVTMREARRLRDNRLLAEAFLIPLLGLADGWGAEAPERPGLRQVLAIAGSGTVCLYGWRLARAGAGMDHPSLWVPVILWCCFVYVYLNTRWSSESGASQTRLLWKQLVAGRRTRG